MLDQKDKALSLAIEVARAGETSEQIGERAQAFFAFIEAGVADRAICAQDAIDVQLDVGTKALARSVYSIARGPQHLATTPQELTRAVVARAGIFRAFFLQQ